MTSEVPGHSLGCFEVGLGGQAGVVRFHSLPDTWCSRPREAAEPMRKRTTANGTGGAEWEFVNNRISRLNRDDVEAAAARSWATNRTRPIHAAEVPPRCHNIVLWCFLSCGSDQMMVACLDALHCCLMRCDLVGEAVKRMNRVLFWSSRKGRSHCFCVRASS